MAKHSSFDSWGGLDQSQNSIDNTEQEQDQSYEINKRTGLDQPVETKETMRAIYWVWYLPAFINWWLITPFCSLAQSPPVQPSVLLLICNYAHLTARYIIPLPD